MLSTLAVVSLLSTGAFAEGNSRIQVKCDVVVVGGGAGGANAAVFAKDKGYSKVCIIEAQPTLGGHCDTYKLDPALVPASCPDIPLWGGRCPDWIDLGVQVYQNTTLESELGYGNHVFDFAEHLIRFAGAQNVKAGSFNLYGPSTTVYADFKHGFPVQIPNSTPQQYQQFEQALERLIGFAYAYPWLDESGIFPDPIPAELLVDFKTFVIQNGMSPLFGPFLQIVLGTGAYGALDKLSTVYGLLAFRKGLLNMFGVLDPTVQSGLFLWGGCQKLYDGILPYIGQDNVYFNSEISQIVRKNSDDDDNSDDSDDRMNRPIRVRFTSNGLRYRIKAKKLIIAIPPTKDNMQPLLSQSSEEKYLFSKVQSRYVATGLFHGAGDGPVLSAARANNQRFKALNLDVFKPDLTPDVTSVNDFSTTWHYTPLYASLNAQSPIPMANAVQELNQAAAAMPSIYASPALNFVIAHDQYQPFFPVEDLRSSPTAYSRFAALQGKSNTIYVGATYSFTESSKILEHAYRTVRDNL